jgi:signal transduction histidine kinase
VPERRTFSPRDFEIWLSWLRLAGVAFAVLEVGVFSPSGTGADATAAWSLTGAFAVASLVVFRLARSSPAAWGRALGAAALVLDTTVLGAYALLYVGEFGAQTRWALILAVIEAAVRYGLAGGVGLSVVLIGYFALNEWWRAHEYAPPGFTGDRVSFPAGVLVFTGLVVGWLVNRLDDEARLGLARAQEAESLRDELGRRVDVLEAANRCARALGSSLEIEQAFGSFIRELHGLVPFDRTAIVLVEDDAAKTIATAGRGSQEVFPPGSVGPLEGSVLAQVLGGRIVVRRDLAVAEYPEDELLVGLGLHSELVAPLVLGARTIGMLSVSREPVGAFSDDEIELVSLLGRLVASAVQNIRAYEAERATVEELRRLSALRADFVSLVSHELRSPMAAVIGAARTLQDRWRSLRPDQREAFLALIGDETARLAALVGDVLDTSQIEAGTFSYRFEDVDLGALVRDVVEAAGVAQEDVEVVASVGSGLPPIRGDRERLHQVLANLVDNAVKYSPEGGTVRVRAAAENGVARITVSDEGPGISYEHRDRIFEKFGRVDIAGASKPGTGLGLFIARSIAEAHGGSLDVESPSDGGATFALTLPVGR